MPPRSAGRAALVKEQKIVIVGSGGVGKSALTIRFITSQSFDMGYNPTIEDSYRKQVVVDDEAVTLEILDTAGQEEYAAMADQWYKFGAGFVLVYSLTDKRGFEALKVYWREILRVKDRAYVPCVVVCNKCDLDHLRQVTQSEGRDLARAFSAPFIECSAIEGINVDVAFGELVKLIRKDERKQAMLIDQAAQQYPAYELQDRDRDRDRVRKKCGGHGHGHGNGQQVSSIEERRQGYGRHGPSAGCRCIVM